MFLISDFIDSSDYRTPLTVAVSRHDVMAIQVYDKRDGEMPDVGLMRVTDLETGRDMWVDTSSNRTRTAYNKWWYARQQQMSTTLRTRASIILRSPPTRTMSALSWAYSNPVQPYETSLLT